jgi:hypothetical protein
MGLLEEPPDCLFFLDRITDSPERFMTRNSSFEEKDEFHENST